MRRRGLTVLIGALLLLLLGWQANDITVPYVALGPGPTFDTMGEDHGKPVIAVSGAPATKSAGQLRLVTVSVHSELTLFDAMLGWLQHDYAVVPKELIYPPDQTEKQVEKLNAEAFKQSQSSAETAALRVLGYPVQVTVTKVVAGSPAESILAIGDVITSIDGTPVTSGGRFSALVRAKPAGASRQISFQRAGAPRTASIVAVAGDNGQARIGVEFEQRQPHPFDLKIDLGGVGGPSAGLMFTLGIIDTLQPEDLTGGFVVVGTGEIDDDGNVGRIGGVPQKLLAAKAARAKVFLTPADNCAEALANAVPGLPLVRVATLDDALKALADLRAGRTPPLCAK